MSKNCKVNKPLSPAVSKKQITKNSQKKFSPKKGTQASLKKGSKTVKKIMNPELDLDRQISDIAELLPQSSPLASDDSQSSCANDSSTSLDTMSFKDLEQAPTLSTQLSQLSNLINVSGPGSPVRSSSGDSSSFGNWLLHQS